MDIDALHSTLVSLTLLPEELRSARETLENAGGASRQELVDLLSSTERHLRIAKVTLARELGFEVCLCCWPPEVMVFHDNGEPYCPEASHGESAEMPVSPRFTPPDSRVGENPNCGSGDGRSIQRLAIISSASAVIWGSPPENSIHSSCRRCRRSA